MYLRFEFVRRICSQLLVPIRLKSIIPECHFLADDGRMLVCYHPTTPIEKGHTQPIRPGDDTRRPPKNKSLTEDQIKLVKKLRKEDEFLWTLSMLSKLFNVEKHLIRQVAPNSERYHEVITEEKTRLAHLRPYKQRLIRAKRELKRKERLRKTITDRGYEFPNKLPD